MIRHALVALSVAALSFSTACGGEEEPDVSAADYPVADDYDIEFTAPDPRTGRLVAPDEGTHSDTEADEVSDDVGRSGGAASAEEAAVHIIEEE